MSRSKASFVTLVGTALVLAAAGCTVTVNKGPTTPEPAPAPTPAPAATTPAPAPTTPAAETPKPEKKYSVDKDGRVNIPGNIVFEKDSSQIQLSDAGTQDVLSQLKLYCDDNPRVTKVRIEGHTDNDGEEAYNVKLSGERALAVKQWLVAAGISADRLMAVGYGEARPIADNATAEGKAQNRRTEFHKAELDGKPYMGKPVAGAAGGKIFE